MKNLIVSLLFVLVSVFGFSQTFDQPIYFLSDINFDSTLFPNKKENEFLTIEVKFTDIHKINGKIKTTNLDSLFLLKSKLFKNRYTYFRFSYGTADMSMWINKIKGEKTKVIGGSHYMFFEKEIKDSTINIVFVNGTKYDIYTKIIQTSENTYGIIMTYKTLRGKEKTYFSKNCSVTAYRL